MSENNKIEKSFIQPLIKFFHPFLNKIIKPYLSYRMTYMFYYSVDLKSYAFFIHRYLERFVKRDSNNDKSIYNFPSCLKK